MSTEIKTIVGCCAALGVEREITSSPVDIEISGNRISAVRPTGEAAPRGEIIDGRNRIVTPGLVNGHTHSHENFHKGRYEGLPLELMMNYVRPPRPLKLTARQVYLRTLIGAIEALKSGTTTLVDDMNIYPILHKDHVEAAFQAYRDIGVRAYLGTTLFDLPYHKTVPFVDEVIPADVQARLRQSGQTPPGEVLEFARHLASTHDPKRDRVAYIVSPSAPQRCSREFLLQCTALAEEFDLPMIMHVQETRTQVVTGELLHKKSLIRYLDDLGVLSDRLNVIHAVFLDKYEIDLLAKRGVSIQHCINANLRLGSGLAPVRELLDAGVNICLGGDGISCTDTINILDLMGTVAKVHAVRAPDLKKAVSAKETWTAATMGGARALRRSKDIGAIEVGRLADLISFRLDRVQLAPRNNLMRQIVYAERGQSLDMVMVDGNVVVRDGTLKSLNEAEIVAEINEAHTALKDEIEASEETVNSFSQWYREIYRRCSEHPVSHQHFKPLIDQS